MHTTLYYALGTERHKLNQLRLVKRNMTDFADLCIFVMLSTYKTVVENNRSDDYYVSR